MDRGALADFLRRRREALQPQEVGLPAGQRRRTRGLRREEVAVLAAMSTDYYTRLEQQRGPQPSEQMLASLARALRLTNDERDYLFQIAGHSAPTAAAAATHVAPALLRVLDRLSDTPALILSNLGETLVQNRMADALFGDMPDDEVMRYYFAELVRLIEGSDLYQVLAHLDFPRRYWPKGPHLYREDAFEEEYRTVLRALASTGRVLEVNTKSPLASVDQIRWWREEGGTAVSFGSDAHLPRRVGDRFKLAVDVVEAAGFKAGHDPYDFWRA